MLTDALVALMLIALLGLSADEALAADFLDPARVQAIARMLPGQPQGLGRPISDRAAWQQQAIPENAERYLTEPLPDQPDDLFLEFSRNGNRTRWQNVAFGRRGRLGPLVWAECVENKGRFLPAIETLIKALCAEKTWVMPAHDRTLTNFEGKSVDIDLGSSALGWSLATADYMLGDKLTPETRALLRERVNHFILRPYRDMLDGKRPPNWWMLTTSNWNAVCLAGVTGTGLALLEPKEDRAAFVAAAEKISLSFLKGFTPDGYCSEGLGYWNYGFGNFVSLVETLRQATGDQVNLLALPQAKAPALFGVRIMADDVACPAFADCAVTSRPAASTMFYLNRVLQLGYPEWESFKPGHVGGHLAEAALLNFPNSATKMPPATGQAPERPLRDWFSDAGILVSRPSGDPTGKLTVALKGGHNAEHHNHNDLGSYAIFLNGRMPLLDPGGEVYTARTFSAKRYDSKLLNSFGHPVPVVAGQLQKPGVDFKAEILATDFTPQQDTVRMSLRRAYDVPDLKSLERTFVFSRQGNGSLTITDSVEYATPQTFETALIARSNWLKLPDGKLMIYDLDQAVQVAFKATGGEVELVPEEIHEDAQVHPTRLGLRLKQPVTAASIEMTITPLAVAADDTGNLLPNGDFEMKGFGWDLPAKGQGAISTEQAASGTHSLKITDPDAKSGSNVNSAMMPAKSEADYVLSGKVFHVSGSGVGMYVRFYDANGQSLNKSDGKGGIAPLGTLEGPQGQWADFSLPFKAEPGTVKMRVWIHSYNAAVVEAYLDDLRIAPK